MIFDFGFSAGNTNPTTLRYSVPGWGSEDIKADLVGTRSLHIHGEKDGHKLSFTERFSRPLDPAKTSVTVKHGILTINVGYTEDSKQSIPVT